jgi:hypothetical protein
MKSKTWSVDRCVHGVTILATLLLQRVSLEGWVQSGYKEGYSSFREARNSLIELELKSRHDLLQEQKISLQSQRAGPRLGRLGSE